MNENNRKFGKEVIKKKKKVLLKKGQKKLLVDKYRNIKIK